MKTVSRAAGYEFSEHGKDSTAGIMGTIDRNGEPRKGDLAGNGFVAWKESQQLIKAAQSDHSSDLLEVINQALDPSGKVSRSLASGDLDYHSRTSLFCTTYTPDPLETNQLELINQGFLPRTVFVYRNWSEDKYDRVNKKRDENLPRPGDNNEIYNSDLKEDVRKLSRTLNYIEDAVFEYGDVTREEDDDPFSQGRQHIDYFKVDDGVSIDPSGVINEVLSQCPFRVRKKAKPFKTRLYDTTYKISACLAAVDKDEENDIYVSRLIKERHVRNAKKLVKFSFNCIVDFIEHYMSHSRNDSLDRIERSVRDICMNDSGKATVREVMRETRSRRNEVRQDLATLEELGLVKTENPVTTLEPDDEVRYVEDNQELRY